MTQNQRIRLMIAARDLAETLKSKQHDSQQIDPVIHLKDRNVHGHANTQ